MKFLKLLLFVSLFSCTSIFSGDKDDVDQVKQKCKDKCASDFVDACNRPYPNRNSIFFSIYSKKVDKDFANCWKRCEVLPPSVHSVKTKIKLNI